jgi:vancomycin resistance protein VanW
MKVIIKKPDNRSKIRLLLGRQYFTIKRYIKWHIGKVKFASDVINDRLPFEAAKHQTPLLRKLRNVDMWLQYNKITNLKLAMERVNGIVVHPGETFSYWKLIGRPTYKKGYKDGMILINGGFKAGVGGGLCQLSNLIYWITLHTSLSVTERYRHSHDVFPDAERTQPFGSGATCVYNYIDLQIYNGTKEDYQLIIHMEDEYLKGEWKTVRPLQYRFDVYEKNHWINQEFWGGYTRHNTIYRKVYDMEGKLLKDEYITENHAIMMYEPLIGVVSHLET